jgi:hypothetical protein
MPTLNISVDAEYQSDLDQPTKPITVQLASPGYAPKLFLHPSVVPYLTEAQRVHQVFESPFAPVDYLGLSWREATPKEKRVIKKTLRLNIFIYFSMKDLEHLFADTGFFREHVLPELDRTRRWFHKGVIDTGLVVMYPNNRGRLEQHRLTFKLYDICAMQGIATLKDCAENVGITMPDKDTYTPEEKGRMLDMYRADPDKFALYALGDLVTYDIYTKTNEFFNQVAELLGLEKRPCWGMSTGSVVASMLSEWLAKRVDVPVKDFHTLTGVAGQNGLTALSQHCKNKTLLYAAMTDGGRAVKERKPDKVEGSLCDIDINGCYGNGLVNQLFAVGNPTVVDELMPLRQFFNRYGSQQVPGLWMARLSCTDMPFRQDLLISKTEERFSLFDNAISMDFDDLGSYQSEDGERVYDASMVLLTQELNQAVLTHDLWQCIKTIASNRELSWLLDNVMVTSALIYEKRHRVEQVTPAMTAGVRCSQKRHVGTEYTKDWVQVPLADYVSVLLKERKKHPKKTPMNTFLKLMVNTSYGVIASSFFSESGSGCSNTVVANNITARARALAWLMAKGFGSYMSVTDGGVFDLNRVNVFSSRSLHLLESLHAGQTRTPHDRKRFVHDTPLLDEEVYLTPDPLETKPDKQQFMAIVPSEGKYLWHPASPKDCPESRAAVDLISPAAWLHLKKTFPGIDLLEQDQFSFEVKAVYDRLVVHSKVDYLLGTPQGCVSKLRGLPGKDSLDNRASKDIAHGIFKAIEDDTPSVAEVSYSELLSHSDWKTHKNRDTLTPHDSVRVDKRFFSHTPLGIRLSTMRQYKRFCADYNKAKATNDPVKVSEVTVTE